MESFDDRQIFLRLKSHDQDALRILFDSYFERLCRCTYRMTGDFERSKDIAQSVFITLWSRRDEIDIQEAIFPYLRTMAIREALAEIRKNTRRAEISANQPRQEQHEPDVEDGYLHQEMQEHIADAINELPAQAGNVFKLSRYEQLSNKEIAQTLDISVKTVENHMTRALKQLRGALQQYLNLFF